MVAGGIHVPDHEDAWIYRETEDRTVIDFCPGVQVGPGYIKIAFNHLNIFPSPKELRRGDEIRIQFTNQQRRRILSGEYRSAGI